MSRKVCFIVFFIFVVYTARDLFTNSLAKSSQSDGADPIKKEIPSMSFKSLQMGPTIEILYCYSCGYQRAFEDYRKVIMDHFPSLNVIGNNYNPSFVKSKLAQIISISKMIVIILLMANINPFNYFGVNTPQFWDWMRNHKVFRRYFYIFNQKKNKLKIIFFLQFHTGICLFDDIFPIKHIGKSTNVQWCI